MVVSLQLHDAPMSYQPPVGPTISFDLYYSQRDVQQPVTFSYVNFGPKWTTVWLSYITANLNNKSDRDSCTRWCRGRGRQRTPDESQHRVFLIPQAGGYSPLFSVQLIP